MAFEVTKLHTMKVLLTLIITLTSILYMNGQSQSESNAGWMAGEYGVWFQLFGGSRLDGVLASGYDYVDGAEEIVDKLPSTGYVLTSFTNSAHGYFFTLRNNTKMDVASIHPDFVPSEENEQVILDVIDIFKKSGKKVLLYIATDGPGASAGTPDNEEYTAAWDAFVESDYDGDEALAYRDLCQGFMERLAPVVDGYWLDHIGGMAGEPEDFVAMIKSVDPTAAIALNSGGEDFTYDDGSTMWVPGVPDFRVERDFKIKKHGTSSSTADYTGGHPTPLGLGAPPNDWSVEEFTHCDMINEPWDTYEGKKVLKHAFVPMQNFWTPPTADLMFTDVEQAYRFVRRLTDAGAAMTWSTSNRFGKMSEDELEILEEVDKRMQMSPMPDYVPYTRPEGAILVGDDATCEVVTNELVETTKTVGPWDLEVLYQVPEWTTTTIDEVDGYTSILYKSIDYLGEPVEVYAYYSAPESIPPVGGWPAVVFAHGGGGSALTWPVKKWNDNGYAAITMDLEGHYPITDLGNPNPGPSRVGVWDDYQLPIEEQWYYHAVAQIIIGHTLIASFPEVDASKVGLLGASWGGTLTSTVMGVDSDRLAWATPVYGAGYLSDSDGHQGDALNDGPETEFVNANYDGRVYFDRVTFPTLWLNSTNDFHFALTANQQSSQAVNGDVTLRYSKGFPHSNLAWAGISEVYAFANQVVNDGAAMPELAKPSITSNIATVSFNAEAGISSAELLFTTDGDDVIWPDRVWNESIANISGNIISANIPADATSIFFTATDTREYMVSSEYLTIQPAESTCMAVLTLNDTPIPFDIYQASDQIQSAGTIAAGSNVTFDAKNMITLNPNFTVASGGVFLAKIGGCTASTLKESNIFEELRSVKNTTINNAALNTVDLSLFPSPTTSEVTLSYQLETPVETVITLHDQMGKILQVLLDSKQTIAGNHQLRFTATGLKSGLYFVVITTPQIRKSQKLMVVR